MNSPASTQTPSTKPPGLILRSDLARLCLPDAYQDTNRGLAWTNSICALFLVIGLLGLKPPGVIVRELARPDDVVPVIFTQPEEARAAEPESKPADAPPEPDRVEPTPVVATVVAANSPSVAFAVPVKGPTILAPARFAEPPPLVTGGPEAPRVTRYNPGAGDRSTPQPDYPRLALQRGYAGKVTVNFTVEASGEISRVELGQSSGFPLLDDAALNVIRTRWRFAPGSLRQHFVEIVFQLK
jgi:TonB family protein